MKLACGLERVEKVDCLERAGFTSLMFYKGMDGKRKVFDEAKQIDQSRLADLCQD